MFTNIVIGPLKVSIIIQSIDWEIVQSLVEMELCINLLKLQYSKYELLLIITNEISNVMLKLQLR